MNMSKKCSLCWKLIITDSVHTSGWKVAMVYQDNKLNMWNHEYN
jgi:hypothetical protein